MASISHVKLRVPDLSRFNGPVGEEIIRKLHTCAEIIGPPFEYKYGCNTGRRTLNQFVTAETYTIYNNNYKELKVKIIKGKNVFCTLLCINNL